MSDTALTQRRSWIVRDNDDKPWGPFGSADAAMAWGRKKWPDILFAEEADQGGFWDIEVVSRSEEGKAEIRQNPGFRVDFAGR